MYSEQELKHAEEFREGIHSEALSRVRAVFPGADRVVDKYPADAYFQQVWDYPGKWYTVVGTPPGAGGRKDLVCAIVRETLEYYRGSGAAFSDGEALRLIAEYPDAACDYRLIGADDPRAKEEGVFPYREGDNMIRRQTFSYRPRYRRPPGCFHESRRPGRPLCHQDRRRTALPFL